MTHRCFISKSIGGLPLNCAYSVGVEGATSPITNYQSQIKEEPGLLDKTDKHAQGPGLLPRDLGLHYLSTVLSGPQCLNI